MSELNMPKPTSGGLLPSYWCNARCRHCYLNCSSKYKEQMSLSDAARYLADFYEVGIPNGDIHITGGEPFIDFGYLKKLLDVPRTVGYKGFGFVETNAFWAVNNSICERRLEILKKSGAQKLCISVDPFHQEFVNKSNVSRLVKICEGILGENSAMLRWGEGYHWKNMLGR